MSSEALSLDHLVEYSRDILVIEIVVLLSAVFIITNYIINIQTDIGKTSKQVTLANSIVLQNTKQWKVGHVTQEHFYT